MLMHFKKTSFSIGLVAIYLSALNVSAEIPQLIRYQGQAVDAQKVPGENGASGLAVVYW